MSDGGREFAAPALAVQHVADKHDAKFELRFKCRHVGPDVLTDLELLTLLLVPTYGWANAETTAERLIAEFRSLGGLLNAPRQRLTAFQGIGPVFADTLTAIRECMVRSARAEIDKGRIIDCWSEVIDYVQVVMGHMDTEQFRCLFLNKKNRLIADEVMGLGTVDHTPVYPRELLRRALLLQSTAVILVHNHPSGDPTPSRSDIQMTRQLVDISAPLGVEIYDHIIVARGAAVSFKGLNLI